MFFSPSLSPAKTLHAQQARREAHIDAAHIWTRSGPDSQDPVRCMMKLGTQALHAEELGCQHML